MHVCYLLLQDTKHENILISIPFCISFSTNSTPCKTNCEEKSAKLIKLKANKLNYDKLIKLFLS